MIQQDFAPDSLRKKFLKNFLTFVYRYVNFVYTKERGIEMSPRTGRPTDNPKEKVFPVRLSEEDVKMLEYCAKVTGKPKAEIIRMGIREVYAKIKK